MLEISLLGSLEIRVDGKPIEVASNYVRALLCFLTIEKNHPHRREALAEMLWPGKPEGVARNSLKQALSNLRKALGDRKNSTLFLLVSRDDVQFNQSSNYQVDAEAFAEQIAASEKHEHEDLVNCKACEGYLQQALNLYQGDFLSDFCLPDNQDFNDWIILKREVFQRQVSETFSKLALICEAQGEIARAVEYSRQLAEIEPWNEGNHRNLMRLLALNGMRSSALRQFQVCCDCLKEELDVEPSNATIALNEEIKACEPTVLAVGNSQSIQLANPEQLRLSEKNVRGKPQPFRRYSQRTLVALIIAGLILGIGSIHWLVATSKSSAAGAQKRIDLPGIFDTVTMQTAMSSARLTETVGVISALTAETKAPNATAPPVSSETMVSTEAIASASSAANSLASQTQALITLYEQTDGPNWENADGWLSKRSPCEWYGVTCRGEKIVKLDLSNNQLKGNIPIAIGSLSSLEYLVLSGNSELKGPIPPELGQLSNLLYLELASEEVGSLLSGQIPKELGTLLKLEVFVIQKSLISGPLPRGIFGLLKLKVLNLGNNQLSGTIHPDIGNLVDLEFLDLGGNAYMSGPIPPEIGRLIRLQYLWLGDSNLSGTLPPEIGNLSRLRILQIDGNPLFGPLPKTLIDLRNQQFWFDRTNLCEPADETFQAWLDSIEDLQSSEIICE